MQYAIYVIVGVIVLALILVLLTQKDKLIKDAYSKVKSRFGHKGKVYKNVYLTLENGDIEKFDVILVHRTGIYIIECIDKEGKIIGKDKDHEWFLDVIKKKKKDKKKFDNPIDKGLSHRRTLNDYLRYVNLEYVSIICFPNKANLKGVNTSQKESPVTNLKHLNKTLKKMIKITDGYINKESTLTINETMKKFSKSSLKTRIQYKKENKRD